MSWFTGDDGKRYELFGAGGGEELADRLEVPLLGQVPLVPALREGGDAGRPIVATDPDGEAGQAFARIAERIDVELAPHPPLPPRAQAHRSDASRCGPAAAGRAPPEPMHEEIMRGRPHRCDPTPPRRSTSSWPTTPTATRSRRPRSTTRLGRRRRRALAHRPQGPPGRRARGKIAYVELGSARRRAPDRLRRLSRHAAG